MEASDDGEFVRYEDYARLEADVERLTFDPMSYLDDHGEWMPRHTHFAAVERLKVQNARLKAKVERLRKAGDGVVAAYCMGDKYVDRWKEYPVVREWLAAKEGRDAK